MTGDAIGRLRAALEGEYRVERELGEGGMATVYLAHDERHDRPVAVKVLLPDLAAIVGADRFLAEIRTTANLRHPNILPLFDSGEADGLLYYVMPYEVDSLKDRLAREGQLRIEEAVRIAGEVAEALDYAHRQGVVHRDIKPGNILLEEGRPLVADFGVALALSEVGSARMTETGLSVGTPSYMSPEQASGERTIDGRTDVYALGCVLYEMLTGAPPFIGRSAQAVLAKVLTTDPEPVSVVRRTVPPNVEAAVQKALERLPADRFTRAQEFAEALADPAFRTAPRRPEGRGGEVAGARSGRLAAAGVVAVAALAGAFLLGRATRPTAGPPPVLRAQLDLGDVRPNGNEDVLVSPDGATFAVAGARPDGSGSLYVRRADELTWRALPGTGGAAIPAFSPDGGWLAFRDAREGAIRKVPLEGGLPVTLVASAGRVESLAWGDDGWIVYSAADGLFRVHSEGGEAEPLLSSTGLLLGLSPLPGGAGVLASNLSRRVVLYEPGADSLRAILEPGVDPTYLPSGHVLYAGSIGGLRAAPFDLRRLEVTGPSTSLLDGVDGTAFWATYAVSAAGTLVYATGSAIQRSERRLLRVASDGAVERVPVPEGRISTPRFSPDGRAVAYTRFLEGSSTSQIYTYDFELGGPTQLTFQERSHGTPVWSPDGLRVAFVARADAEGEARTVEIRSLAERAPLPPVYQTSRSLTLNDWPAPDLLVFTDGVGQGADLRVMEPVAGAEPRPYLASPDGEAAARVSPDGRWVAYVSNETETAEVYVRRFPEAVSQGLISQGGGTQPRWSPGGDAVYYLKAAEPAADTILRARVQLEPTFVLRSREVAYVGEVVDFDVDPASGSLLVLELVGAAAESLPPRFYVVTNWLREVRERLTPR